MAQAAGAQGSADYSKISLGEGSLAELASWWEAKRATKATGARMALGRAGRCPRCSRCGAVLCAACCQRALAAAIDHRSCCCWNGLFIKNGLNNP